jgi:GT2 family glycosyltransferase
VGDPSNDPGQTDHPAGEGPGDRPAVAVVMPFAGTPAQASAALAALATLRVRPGDTVALADNSATVAPNPPPGIAVIAAAGEHSPARARNAGAAGVGGTEIEWILFLDADCRPDAGLIDAFFAEPIPAAAGAVAGEIHAIPSGRSLAARSGASRNFLTSATHMAHPYRPRVAAANLLVRRAAFVAVGGFREGSRAAEDTDFCWRLQEAGWTLAVRPQATAGHAYRTDLRDLRAQWRGYAAGRAWLGRAYPDFHPEPALTRAARRAGLGWLPGVGRVARTTGPRGPLAAARVNPGSPPRSLRERIEFLFVDVVLGLEELRGLRGSNDPR